MNPALARRLRCLIVLLRLSFFVLLWPAAQACAQTAGPVFPNPGKTSMSRENQQALGMEVAAQVYQQMPVLPDSSPESQYIRQLGQKLVATIPSQYSWPFEFLKKHSLTPVLIFKGVKLNLDIPFWKVIVSECRQMFAWRQLCDG